MRLRSAKGLGLAALAVLAVWLRFDGLAWDRGLGFHPDEQNLVRAALRADWISLADPGFHAYNGLALYGTRALLGAASLLMDEPDWTSSRSAATYAARTLSALASLAAVALAWCLGRRLAGDRLAVLFAAGLAFSAGLVQAAHFGTTEGLLVLGLLATALAAARLVAEPARALRNAALCGVAVGLSTGAKTTGLAYLVLPAVALAIALPALGLRRTAAAGVVALSAAFLAFALVSPHSIAHVEAFLASMRYERAVATGAQPVFYTLQFRGATSGLFELASLHWLCGPALPALGIAGSVALALAAARDRRLRAALPLLAFGAVYAAWTASLHAKFVRYLLPLLPPLLLGAAWALDELLRRAPRALGPAVLAVVAVATLGWTGAFTSVYRAPHTRLEASRWLLEHASPGSVVMNERRDHPLPATAAPHALRFATLDGFGADRLPKLVSTAQTIARADWWVVGSRRVHAVTRAQRDLFPFTGALYELLFEGGIGWELAARFESQPRLLGLELRDDAAEETFRVFDHPTVWIFRNAGRASPDELRRAVAAAAARDAP